MMSFFAAEGIHVSVKAEPVFAIGSFDVTNSMLLGLFGYLLVLAWLLFVAKKANNDSGKKGFFTRLAIWCYTGLYRTCQEAIPNKKICNLVAPFAISLFFFIALQYYIGLLPFVGEAVTWDGVPLLRGPDADLNMTFGLAILAIIFIQIAAVIKHGFRGNIKRYIKNPFKNMVGFFEGILELIAEFSRLVALSMRLFGNVFAGEVLLLIASWLTSFASPIILPFLYIFEMFIGGIQAYVFFSLTIAFTGLAIADHHDHHDHNESPKSDDVKQLAEASVI
jgi:F-type H+-transporting ATPase subunit a